MRFAFTYNVELILRAKMPDPGPALNLKPLCLNLHSSGHWAHEPKNQTPLLLATTAILSAQQMQRPPERW